MHNVFFFLTYALWQYAFEALFENFSRGFRMQKKKKKKESTFGAALEAANI